MGHWSTAENWRSWIMSILNRPQLQFCLHDLEPTKYVDICLCIFNGFGSICILHLFFMSTNLVLSIVHSLMVSLLIRFQTWIGLRGKISVSKKTPNSYSWSSMLQDWSWKTSCSIQRPPWGYLLQSSQVFPPVQPPQETSLSRWTGGLYYVQFRQVDRWSILCAS